jgi:hypothetical protein
MNLTTSDVAELSAAAKKADAVRRIALARFSSAYLA